MFNEIKLLLIDDKLRYFKTFMMKKNFKAVLFLKKISVWLFLTVSLF